MEWAICCHVACVIRPFVCPSVCPHFCKLLLLPMTGSIVPRWACIQVMLKVKVEVNGHEIWAAVLWFHKIASFPRQKGGLPSDLHRMVPTLVCIQDMLKVKVEVKVHVTLALLWFHKKTKSLLLPGMAGSWTNSLLCLPPLSFLRSLFFCTTIPKWLWVCAVSSTIAHIMKQYDLMFCLTMHTVYEAPFHSLSRLSIRQLNLMSKFWNELLRYW